MHIFEMSFFGIKIAPTWYGLMYAIGFWAGYWFVKKYGKIKQKDLENLLTYIFFWVILGWRIGYIILYNLDYYFHHPLEMFAVWNGGMSFHGGAIWVIIAMIFFARKYKYKIFDISDPIVTILPFALGLGRIGNYINGELLGFYPYNWPFSIVKDGISHFPSTLLEASGEGFLLLLIMLSFFFWDKYQKKNPQSELSFYEKRGFPSFLFLMGYGFFRLFAEFFRLPDIQIGYLSGTNWITLGMVYTLPIFIIALWVQYKIRKESI